MQEQRILIVDDEENVLRSLERTLMDEDYEIETAGSAEEALEKLKTFPAGIVLSDNMMPGMNGLDFLQQVKQIYPNTIRILITGKSDVQMTIEAINKGEIFRFLLKPWNDEELKVTIRIAFRYHDLITENKRLSETVDKQSSLLEEIEIKYPGITKVKREEDGSILFHEEYSDDVIQSFQLKEKDIHQR